MLQRWLLCIVVVSVCTQSAFREHFYVLYLCTGKEHPWCSPGTTLTVSTITQQSVSVGDTYSGFSSSHSHHFKYVKMTKRGINLITCIYVFIDTYYEEWCFRVNYLRFSPLTVKRSIRAACEHSCVKSSVAMERALKHTDV